MLPTIFPIVTLFLLAPVYKISKKIFLVFFLLELAIFAFGFYYIDQNFSHFLNKTLYYTALGGTGLITALIAFFIAIFSRHSTLYPQEDTHE